MTNTGLNHKGIELVINGEKVFLSVEIINELHKQENIQWGKDIVVNYVSDEKYATITDDDFEAIAVRLEELEMEDNGDLEQQAIREVIGLLED